MADTKISGLTADTTPTTDDLLVTVNDPAGTPANKKSTIAQVLGAILTTVRGLTIAAGDILYGDGVNSFTNLAKGTANQLLGMNAGATAPEYKSTISVTSITDTVKIVDDGDATKAMQFQCSGITAGQTRVLTPPDGDGNLVVTGVTLDYEIDAIPIGWAIDGGTAPGALATLSSTNKAKYRDFSGAADNDVFIEWMVPYGIDATVAPVFQVEGWVTNATGPAQTETIKFALAGASYGDSDILSGALGSAVTVTYTEATPATHVQYDRLISGWSTAVTITNLAAGELVILNLKRDVTDTYAQSIGVGWLKVKYAKKLQAS